MTPIRLTEEAKADMRAAAFWLDEHFPGTGTDFLLDLDDALDRVEDGPFLYPKIYKDFRRCLLRRFSYKLIYEVTKDEIIVLVIVHTSRNPDYWQERLN